MAGVDAIPEVDHINVGLDALVLIVGRADLTTAVDQVVEVCIKW